MDTKKCGMHWGIGDDWCKVLGASHECPLTPGHDGDHTCPCGVHIPCVCICHTPEAGPVLTSHIRPCCIDWVGGFWGKVGEAYPLLDARIRRDERAETIAALERIIEGRRSYMAGLPDEHWVKETLLTEVDSYETVIRVLRRDPFVMQDLLPTFMWTQEEENAVRGEDDNG